MGDQSDGSLRQLRASGRREENCLPALCGEAKYIATQTRTLAGHVSISSPASSSCSICCSSCFAMRTRCRSAFETLFRCTPNKNGGPAQVHRRYPRHGKGRHAGCPSAGCARRPDILVPWDLVALSLLWAVVMAFFSLLPAIGAGLIWIPVAVYLLGEPVRSGRAWH